MEGSASQESGASAASWRYVSPSEDSLSPVRLAAPAELHWEAPARLASTDQDSQLPISPRGENPAQSQGSSPAPLASKHRAEERELLGLCGGHLQLLGQLLAADAAVTPDTFGSALSRSCDALSQALGAPTGEAAATVDNTWQQQPQSSGSNDRPWTVQLQGSPCSSHSLQPLPSALMNRRFTKESGETETTPSYAGVPDDISITLAGMSSVALWGSHSSGIFVKHVRTIMSKTWVESFWLLCIVVNTGFMMIEEQYLGALEGYRLGFYEETGSSRYPTLEAILMASDFIFVGIFTVEIIMRLVAMGRKFWRSPGCVVDLLVVIATDVGLALRSRVNIQVFRLMRLTRILRIVRLVKSVEGVESLQVMATSLRACVTSATWAIVILGVGLTVFALLMTMIVRNAYLEEESNSGLGEEEKLELFRYFGSYTRSMVSMFELALANWPNICRFLQEELYEGWAVAAIFYKLTVGFAMIGILNAVFMQETFSAIEIDDSIMVSKKKRADKAHGKKMLKLFKHADRDLNGYLSRSEFRRVLRSPAIKTWLSSMNLDVNDGDLLFELIDVAGSGRITLDDLVRGVASLRGPSRSIDVKALRRTSLEREVLRAEDLARARGPRRGPQ